MKKNKSKSKVRFKCPDCGSIVKRDIIEGVVLEFCSNDLIPEYSDYFSWFHKQCDDLKVSLMSQWDDMKHNLYGQWFISTQDGTPFICDWKIDPRAKLLTPSKCTITFPDTAQVMIAEAILKRPLTEGELTGARHIPIIDENGIHGEGLVELLKFPKDVTLEYKDMTVKYNPDPTIKLFDWDDL